MQYTIDLSYTGWSRLLATSVSGYSPDPAPPARRMPFMKDDG
ncbi:MAG TPA: hypothetical protein PKE47_13680 [Verrucomicrobiota bacterium]|nr:hypothetical protein [Verrucomicrobiota bacterium]